MPEPGEANASCALTAASSDPSAASRPSPMPMRRLTARPAAVASPAPGSPKAPPSSSRTYPWVALRNCRAAGSASTPLQPSRDDHPLHRSDEDVERGPPVPDGEVRPGEGGLDRDVMAQRRVGHPEHHAVELRVGERPVGVGPPLDEVVRDRVVGLRHRVHVSGQPDETLAHGRLDEAGHSAEERVQRLGRRADLGAQLPGAQPFRAPLLQALQRHRDEAVSAARPGSRSCHIRPL